MRLLPKSPSGCLRQRPHLRLLALKAEAERPSTRLRRRMRSARPKHHHHSPRLAEAERPGMRRRLAIQPGQVHPEFLRLAGRVVEAPPRLPVPKPFPLGLDVQWRAAEPRLRRKRALAGPSPSRLVNLVPATAVEAPPPGPTRRDFPDCAQHLVPKAAAQPRAHRVRAGYAAHPTPPDLRVARPRPAPVLQADSYGHSHPAEEQALHRSPSARPARAPWLTWELKA